KDNINNNINTIQDDDSIFLKNCIIQDNLTVEKDYVDTIRDNSITVIQNYQDNI
ncbi:35725_t:CDS:1, partial [Racocetra persica]